MGKRKAKIQCAMDYLDNFTAIYTSTCRAHTQTPSLNPSRATFRKDWQYF